MESRFATQSIKPRSLLIVCTQRLRLHASFIYAHGSKLSRPCKAYSQRKGHFSNHHSSTALWAVRPRLMWAQVPDTGRRSWQRQRVHRTQWLRFVRGAATVPDTSPPPAPVHDRSRCLLHLIPARTSLFSDPRLTISIVVSPESIAEFGDQMSINRLQSQGRAQKGQLLNRKQCGLRDHLISSAFC